MDAASLEFSLTEERMRRYARTIQRAFLVTAALHLACAVALNPSLILRFFAPRTLIGYPGASRPGDLAAEGTPGQRGGHAFRAQHLAGPATLIRLEVTSRTSGLVSDRPATDAIRAGTFEPVATSSRVSSGASGQDSGVHLELDENGSLIGGSGGSAGAARSEKFQTLRIVRPEYPKAAIRAGLEGLVRLEVQVDTAGTVIGVRTEMNTTKSQEMEDKATEAMLLWLFKPYRERDRPVPFTLVVPFRYRLVD